MTTAKYTQGPWSVGVSNSVIATSPDLRIICQPFTDGTYGPILSRDEQEANAVLLAASPELLTALKQVNDCLVKCLTGGEVSAKFAGKAIETAALLIERIEGESK